MALDGDTLYGTCRERGSASYGTVWKIKTDGSDYTVLHAFGSPATNGWTPYGSVTLVVDRVYGMTYGLVEATMS